LRLEDALWAYERDPDTFELKAHLEQPAGKNVRVPRYLLGQPIEGGLSDSGVVYGIEGHVGTRGDRIPGKGAKLKERQWCREWLTR
jgi:hypothetical protein